MRTRKTWHMVLLGMTAVAGMQGPHPSKQRSSAPQELWLHCS